MPPFDAVVVEHGTAVLRLCRSRLGAADADDAWSETFLAALRAYPSLPAGSNVRAWLFTIAHHKVIDVFRRHGRSADPIDLRAIDLPGGDGIPEPPDSSLGAALAGLTPRQRDAVVLHAAEREGLLDVAYRVVDSPVGALLVAATPGGLVRVAFEREDHERVLATLADVIGPRILRGGALTEVVARQLDEYFVGQRRTFDVPIDLQLVRGFRRDVIATLPAIAYGATRSYAQVAAAAGNPAAVRAVGSACSHNPVPVVVPCHRVVRSDGAVGEYLGGTAAKVALLRLEAAA